MKTCFAPLIGRLGNLLFIYAYHRAFCEQNGYEMVQFPWVGEKIFNIPEARRPGVYQLADVVLDEQYYQNQQSLIYTRSDVKRWFSLKPELIPALESLPKGAKVFDLRHGSDMIGSGFVHISRKSYEDAAAFAGYDSREFIWVSDLKPFTLEQFGGDPSASGLCTTWFSLPQFYVLMNAKVHFRSNSTFGWWAATLGNAKVYSPIISGLFGGIENEYCSAWVDENWPMCVHNAPNTDLFLRE